VFEQRFDNRMSQFGLIGLGFRRAFGDVGLFVLSTLGTKTFIEQRTLEFVRTPGRY
jgi:hypothetical protein